ncbi:MAG: ACT domain-containing protein [Candidatus Altiarchaeota archaeon]
MKIEVRLGLKDVPGMLVKALEPISDKGGNISSVVHSRGAKDVVDVIVVFKVKDESTLNRIISALKKEKVSIREVKVEGRKYYKKKSLSIILIGHVIDNDIQETIDRFNAVGRVSDVDVKMSDPDAESSVLMKIEYEDKKEKNLMDEVEKVCDDKKLLLIREL